MGPRESPNMGPRMGRVTFLNGWELFERRRNKTSHKGRVTFVSSARWRKLRRQSHLANDAEDRFEKRPPAEEDGPSGVDKLLIMYLNR